MGYYTNHEFAVVEGNITTQEFLKKLESEDPEHNLLYAVGEDGNFRQEMKWYNYEEEMRALSLKHPGVVLKLYGNGEDSQDIWHEYYKDGKAQYCEAQLVFDPYDEAQLK